MYEAIKAILTSRSELTDIVSSSNMTPLTRVQGASLPAIVYEVTDIDPTDCKGDGSAQDEVKIQVTGFSDNVSEAYNIYSEIRNSMDQTAGEWGTSSPVVFDLIRFIEASDSFYDVDEEGVYHWTCFYIAHIRRDAVTPNYPAGVNDPVTIRNAAPGNAAYSEDTSENLTLPTITLEDEDSQEATLFPVVDIKITNAEITSATLNEVTGKYEIAVDAGITPAGRRYLFPLPFSQHTIYETYDEGWHVNNGTFDYTGAPANPAEFVALDTSSDTPGEELAKNNAFDNTDRFTDDAGGQTYSNDLVIDHLTGLMWLRVAKSSALWQTALGLANSATDGGYSDWRIPTNAELLSIHSQETLYVFPPFPDLSGRQLHSCTIYRANTTHAHKMWGYSLINRHSRTSSIQYALVRNHYV